MRVLLATDGSSDAATAAEWLPHLPLPFEREILVLTAIEPPLLPAVPDVVGASHSELLGEAQRLADDTAARFITGRTATGRVVEGDAREEIISGAESWGADLIILGARGLGAVQKFLLGSVSLGVARHAPCSVLVCKGVPRAVRTVTVGLDGSEHARGALAWLVAHPLPAGLRVRLVGVAEPQRYPSTAPGILSGTLRAAVTAIETERRTLLEHALAATARDLPVKNTEIAVMTGAPAEVIVRDAESHGSDLIVVGARGAGLVTRLLLGSVSEAVLSHAGCPVLVVRPRRP